MKNKQKNILWAILVLVAVIAVYFYFNQQQATAPTTDIISEEVPNDRPDDGTLGGEEIIPSNDKIIVATQLAGNWVTVDNIALSKPGFVVIHEANAQGNPGKIIGSSNWLSAGSKQDLEIKATLASGKQYFAMLHYDNGDKKFDPATDPMATGGKATEAFNVE